MKETKLSEYLRKDRGIIPKTVRAEEALWLQVRTLADKYGCSQNELIVAALTKLCDEEKLLGK